MYRMFPTLELRVAHAQAPRSAPRAQPSYERVPPAEPVGQGDQKNTEAREDKAEDGKQRLVEILRMAQPPISAAAEGGLKGLSGAAAELRWCFRVSRAFGIREPAMKLHAERGPFKPQSLDFTAGPGLLHTS